MPCLETFLLLLSKPFTGKRVIQRPFLFSYLLSIKQNVEYNETHRPLPVMPTSCLQKKRLCSSADENARASPFLAYQHRHSYCFSPILLRLMSHSTASKPGPTKQQKQGPVCPSVCSLKSSCKVYAGRNGKKENKSKKNKVQKERAGINCANFVMCSLQLGLGGLEGGGEEVAHVGGGLVEVEAHAVAAETLGDNVEVDASQLSVFIIHPVS